MFDNPWIHFLKGFIVGMLMTHYFCTRRARKTNQLDVKQPNPDWKE